MATQAELAAELTGIKTQFTKALDEVKTNTAKLTAKIGELEEIIRQGGGTSPEVDAIVADLKAIAATYDDLNPDAPAPAPA